MSKNDSDSTPATGAVMSFGAAPGILGVVGAIAGAVILTWFRPDALMAPGMNPWFYTLGGAAFGAGAGWLLGLIAGMGWLGE